MFPMLICCYRKHIDIHVLYVCHKTDGPDANETLPCTTMLDNYASVTLTRIYVPDKADARIIVCFANDLVSKGTLNKLLLKKS